MRTPCGCVIEDAGPGIRRSVEKCAKHKAKQRETASLDASYYRELGLLDERGNLKQTKHVAELREALGDLPRGGPSAEEGFRKGKTEGVRLDPASSYSFALEIGCGVSPYARYLSWLGYSYLGLDESPFAAEFTNKLWRPGQLPIFARCASWPNTAIRGKVHLVLSAHSLEHMRDPFAAIKAMHDVLVPGGWLVLLVPDDSDLCNPDHLWFFSADGLGALLEDANFHVERTAVRRIVPQENFIYTLAQKL